jgi:hypothetical protein
MTTDATGLKPLYVLLITTNDDDFFFTTSAVGRLSLRPVSLNRVRKTYNALLSFICHTRDQVTQSNQRQLKIYTHPIMAEVESQPNGRQKRKHHHPKRAQQPRKHRRGPAQTNRSAPTASEAPKPVCCICSDAENPPSYKYQNVGPRIAAFCVATSTKRSAPENQPTSKQRVAVPAVHFC